MEIKYPAVVVEFDVKPQHFRFADGKAVPAGRIVPVYFEPVYTWPLS